MKKKKKDYPGTIERRKDREGNTTFLARIRIAGLETVLKDSAGKGQKEQSFTFADEDEASAEESAKKWLREGYAHYKNLLAIGQRNRPEMERVAKTLQTTVGDLLKLFRTKVTLAKLDDGSYIRKNENQRQSEDYCIRSLLTDPISDMRVTEVASRDIVIMRDRLLEERGLSANTVRLHMTALSSCYKAAINKWVKDFEISENPCVGVAPPSLPDVRKRRVSPDEEEKILKSAHEVNPELADIIRIAIDLGARGNEIHAMTWDKVFFDDGFVIVRNKRTRRSVAPERPIPLLGQSKEVLMRQHARLKEKLKPGEQMPERVWSYKTMSGLRSSWQEARNRSGVENLKFHDFRREANSRMVMSDMSVEHARRIMGHLSPAMTDAYLQALGKEMVTAIIKKKD